MSIATIAAYREKLNNVYHARNYSGAYWGEKDSRCTNNAASSSSHATIFISGDCPDANNQWIHSRLTYDNNTTVIINTYPCKFRTCLSIVTTTRRKL